MREFIFPLNIDVLPRPADVERARRGMERWNEAAGQIADPADAAFAASLPDDSRGRALLEALFGNSAFLSRCVAQEPAFTCELLREGPEAAFSRMLSALREDLWAETDTSRVMRLLRVAKRRAALAIAVADIGGVWGLDPVTEALTRFADTAAGLATAHLLRQEAASGEIVLAHPDDPERGSGFVVLGMGKLGAWELNYSSDIDLIVLYDEERIVHTGRRSVRECCVRMTRNLVRILNERTADGYVFRTDLRLRPDPGSTPLAVSLEAAEIYYENFGQNWERAAMIKARCIAGDREAGARFLKFLKPYIWRRSLDFNAIQDIHSIKRQIHAHKGGASIAVGGHNIKLGRGGIREIEFFAQTQQLIWGGRESSTRSPRTCDALRSLTAAGHVDAAATEELIACYHYLRRLEHRLQMIDDQQTQTLPTEPEKLEELAAFMGHADLAELSSVLLRTLETVERHYAALFEEAPDLSGAGNLVFTGSEDDPGTVETLRGMGFDNPVGVIAAVRGWHHGRYRAVRTARARELLTELQPKLLDSLAMTAAPDAAFAKFDEFLRRLPAGVPIFSLFHANPGLLGLVAEIMGDAPRLADILARTPSLLDNVLAPGFFDPLPDAEVLMVELDTRLAEARDYEEVLDFCRRWANDRKFQVGVQILRNMITPADAGAALTVIAEAVLSRLYPRVEREFAAQHGYLPSAGMAIVAMGKMGGREMTATSDIDLILVYETPDESDVSTGMKPLPAMVFYTRLTQRFVNAITAQTNEGKLYEVDMRLRPSGNKGPLATSFQSFEKYHAEAAWTWERMALTRARVLYGPPDLTDRLNALISGTLTRQRDQDKLVVDVADMRIRLEKEKKAQSRWVIKYTRGGLVDIEFIAQYLQLRHAPGRREILSPNTADALRRIRDAGLIGEDEARTLLEGLAFWTALHNMVRQSLERVLDDGAPAGLKQKLCQAVGADDFADLSRRMDEHGTRVHTLFRQWIEDPAARLRALGGSPPREDAAGDDAAGEE
ncbi:MAG: bifunctional [glutamine synthetase] adenylyltransferase/[glutamine synthetase]-adenylyl-L-tyrosine phosphorylase [Alphaproteobacteria bacterium]|nr:bifunctional [glutamine synthetase] adenylyltransferase/[glutamine synthetase]-adenylyl-L-tyrosine phosphorylase [Alphaproteobacteria bacterium]